MRLIILVMLLTLTSCGVSMTSLEKEIIVTTVTCQRFNFGESCNILDTHHNTYVQVRLDTDPIRIKELCGYKVRVTTPDTRGTSYIQEVLEEHC